MKRTKIISVFLTVCMIISCMVEFSAATYADTPTLVYDVRFDGQNNLYYQANGVSLPYNITENELFSKFTSTFTQSVVADYATNKLSITQSGFINISYHELYTDNTDSQTFVIQCTVKPKTPETAKTNKTLSEYTMLKNAALTYFNSYFLPAATNISNTNDKEAALLLRQGGGTLENALKADISQNSTTEEITSAYYTLIEAFEAAKALESNTVCSKYFTTHDTHTHTFVYSASSDNKSIVATCMDVKCDLYSSPLTLTINAPALKEEGSTESEKATLTGLSAFNSATGFSISEDDIVYFKVISETENEQLSSAPKTAGKYIAVYKLLEGDNSIEVYLKYTIAEEGSAIIPAEENPDIPTQAVVSEVTSYSIVVNAVQAQEYVIVEKGGTPSWDNASMCGNGDSDKIWFNQNLSAATEYDIYTRIAATDTKAASVAVKTTATTMLNGYAFSGDSYVGDTLSVKPDPESAAGITFQWYYGTKVANEDGWARGDKITGATASTYTPAESDIGKYVGVVMYKNGTEVGSTSYRGPIEAAEKKVVVTVDTDKKTVTVSRGGKTLTTGTYSINFYKIVEGQDEGSSIGSTFPTEPGEYYVKVTILDGNGGNEEYYQEFTVNKPKLIDLSNASVIVSADAKSVVVYNDNKLVSSDCYDLFFSDYTVGRLVRIDGVLFPSQNGIYVATVTGIEDKGYTGSAESVFTISSNGNGSGTAINDNGSGSSTAVVTAKADESITQADIAPVGVGIVSIVTDDVISDILKSARDNSAEVNVTTDSEGDIKVSEEAIGEIAAGDVPVTFNVDAEEGVDYSITIDPELVITVKAFNLAMNINIVNDGTTLSNNGVEIPSGSILIAPAMHGDFGMTVKVTIPAVSLKSIDWNDCYFYYVDDDGNLHDLSEEDDVVKNDDGSLSVFISHASAYIITPEDLSYLVKSDDEDTDADVDEDNDADIDEDDDSEVDAEDATENTGDEDTAETNPGTGVAAAGVATFIIAGLAIAFTGKRKR